MRGSRALACSVIAVIAFLGFGACSAADKAPSQTIPSGGGGSGGSATGGTAGDTGISVGGIGGLDGGSDVIAPDAACAKVTKQATNTPLDLYIMLDRSSSMGGSTPGDKWNSSVAGLTAFVNDTDSTGIRVALKFFPRDPDNVPACDQQAYATPDVPYDVPSEERPADHQRDQRDDGERPEHADLSGARRSYPRFHRGEAEPPG